MSTTQPPDIDRILGAILADAARRGAPERVDMPAVAFPVATASHGLPMTEPTQAADFLALPLDVFLFEAYARLLGRAPDAEGLSHYQRALLRGRLTRMEVLGRLAYSPEGRRHRGKVRGVAPAFVLATLYRVPVAGPVLGFVARLLAVPAHWRDRGAIEAAALASGAWMKR